MENHPGVVRDGESLELLQCQNGMKYELPNVEGGDSDRPVPLSYCDYDDDRENSLLQAYVVVNFFVIISDCNNDYVN